MFNAGMGRHCRLGWRRQGPASRASYGPRAGSTTCALRLFLGGPGLSLGKEARIQSRAFQMNDAMFCFSETCLPE